MACLAREACMGDVHGGGMHDRGHAWQGRGMHGKDCAWQGTCMAGGVQKVHGRGHAWWGCTWQGHAWQGACMAGEMATAADGTHTTGMHSCVSMLVKVQS